MNDFYKKIGPPEVKVIEECAELIKAISKAQRFGWDNYHPKTPSISNTIKVRREMYDVEDAIRALRGFLDGLPVDQACCGYGERKRW